MSAPGLAFNIVHIIESLRPGDHHTGRRLYDDLAPLADASTPPVKARYNPVQSRTEFLALLESIAIDARRYSHLPILHLEAHGSSTGIQVTSGECLTWTEFKDELIAINEITKLNLLVILAACEGASLLQTITPLDRAPWCIMIGPDRNVTAGEIERACQVFWRTLFDAGDVAPAWRAMNAAAAPPPLTFRVFTAEGVFHHVIDGYFATHCSEDALARREREAVAQLEQMGNSGEALEDARQEFRRGIRDHRRHFERFKERFFFCDLYPENVARFGVTFEDCQRDPREP